MAGVIFWQKTIPTVEAYSMLEAKAKHVATSNLSNTHTIFGGLNNLWATHGNPRTLKSQWHMAVLKSVKNGLETLFPDFKQTYNCGTASIPVS